MKIPVAAFALLGPLALPLPAAEPSPLMATPKKGAVSGRLPTVPPTPASEAVKSFRVLDGFRMDLLAAEPLITSPVAMAYDEDGRAYVCEMRDYPYTDKANHKPGQENPTDQPIGRISLLVDTDDDGVFDQSTRFAEGLSWPTGVACWKGGVFVAATPDLWYLKDTDGDGRADLRERVFTGFKKLNVQAVMNNLVWGLDHRIHGAGGSNGGLISAPDKPGSASLSLARADFAFDPQTRAFSLQSGGARFGGSFDDWGNRFLCNIRNPAQHIVLPSHYLARNRHLAAPSPIHDMAESGDQLPVYAISPPEPWRQVRAQRWAGERDINMPRSELVGAGVVTSSSGITRYRGSAYPEKYRDSVFVCECAGNLFYRLQLTPDGVTFKAARVDGQAEMVASTDNWFRPVNFINAPDGTLHVMDMYRENIEHPWSIPDDIHAAVDLEAGRDKGRLWRLTPPNFKRGQSPKLSRASSAELVATLAHPDSWWRETAQRLLFERQDHSTVPALLTLVKTGRSPQGRLHALWALHGLGQLPDEALTAALRDSEAGVRENALRLAESRPSMHNALLAGASDPAARVRFQAAFSLGEINSPAAVAALAKIAQRDAADPWARTAILSSTAETSADLLALLLQDRDFASRPDAASLIRELAQIIGSRGQQTEMQQLVSALQIDTTQPSPIEPILIGLGEGLKRKGKNLRSAGLTETAAETMNRVLKAAAHTALDTESRLEQRQAAIQLLTFDDYAHASQTLPPLLEMRQPQELQIAAISALSRFTEADVVTHLLAHWKTQTPAVRSSVIMAMTSARTRALPLMQAIQSGLIPASQVPFPQRRLLTLHADPQVKELAAAYFSASAPGPRQPVIEKYQAALSLNGEATRGRRVFETACIACHRAGDLGQQDIGPNLANIRAWNPEQVLINILDPNREVVPSFLAYNLETQDGQSHYGMITEENTTSLTLKRPDGLTETHLRSDIRQITGSGQSLMPEGLEATLTLENMADLIAFLLPQPAQ